MKKTTAAKKVAPTQKADSRKVPTTLRKTSRTQKTPAGERNDPMGSAETGSSPEDNDLREEMRSEGITYGTASSEAEDSERAYDDSHSVGEVRSHEAGGFHVEAMETRKQRAEHEKGHIEEVAAHSFVPPAQSPGQPGSAPRIQQRRSVYERGNRYPLTHAPKA